MMPPYLDRRKRKSSSVIDDLPNELLEKILTHIPVMYAAQCKSVCKRWYSLKPSHCCSTQIPHVYPLDDSVTFMSYFSDKIVASYFEDLILYYYRDRPFVYYICNPLTKQSLRLPPAPPLLSHDQDSIAGFICYPHCCCNNNNNKCVTINAHYSFKVVRVPNPKLGSAIHNQFKVDIFSSETGQWRDSLVSCPRHLKGFNWYPNFKIVAYNQKLHWLNQYGNNIFVYDPLNNIDMCSIIKPPNPIRDTRANLEISGGCLRVYLINFLYLMAWDYKRGKWEFKEEFLYDPDEMVSQDPELKWYAQNLFLDGEIIGFHPIDPSIVYFQFGRVDKIICCNMRTRTLQVVFNFEPLENHIMEENKGRVFPLCQRWWPTPVPSLPLCRCVGLRNIFQLYN